MLNYTRALLGGTSGKNYWYTTYNQTSHFEEYYTGAVAIDSSNEDIYWVWSRDDASSPYDAIIISKLSKLGIELDQTKWAYSSGSREFRIKDLVISSNNQYIHLLIDSTLTPYVLSALMSDLTKIWEKNCTEGNNTNNPWAIRKDGNNILTGMDFTDDTINSEALLSKIVGSNGTITDISLYNAGDIRYPTIIPGGGAGYYYCLLEDYTDGYWQIAVLTSAFALSHVSDIVNDTITINCYDIVYDGTYTWISFHSTAGTDHIGIAKYTINPGTSITKNLEKSISLSTSTNTTKTSRMAKDSSGNIYILWTSNAGTIYVNKFDASLNSIWNKKLYYTSNTIKGYNIYIDANDYLYIPFVGTISSNVRPFLAKLPTDGTNVTDGVLTFTDSIGELTISSGSELIANNVSTLNKHTNSHLNVSTIITKQTDPTYTLTKTSLL